MSRKFIVQEYGWYIGSLNASHLLSIMVRGQVLRRDQNKVSNRFSDRKIAEFLGNKAQVKAPRRHRISCFHNRSYAISQIFLRNGPRAARCPARAAGPQVSNLLQRCYTVIRRSNKVNNKKFLACTISTWPTRSNPSTYVSSLAKLF